MKIIAKFSSKCGQCGNPIQAGDQIEWVKGYPAIHLICPSVKAAKNDAPVSNEDGDTASYYQMDGAFYRIRAGKKYAEKLTQISGNRLNENDDTVKFDYVYDSGAVYRLKPEMQLTLDAAKAFGIQYGICVVCTKRLKDAKSVADGIGPVCAKKTKR